MDLDNSFEDIDYKHKDICYTIVDLSNIELEERLIGENVIKMTDENKALIEDSDDENDIREVDIEKAVGALTMLRYEEDEAFKKLQEVRIEILQQKQYIEDLKNRRFIQQVERENYLLADEDVDTGLSCFREVRFKQVSEFDYDLDSLLKMKHVNKILADPRTSKIERYASYRKWVDHEKEFNKESVVGINFGLEDSLMEVIGYYLGHELLHEKEYNRVYHNLRRKLSVEMGFDVTSIYPDRSLIERYCDERYVMRIRDIQAYRSKEEFEQSAVMLDARLKYFIVTMHLILDLKSGEFQYRGPTDFEKKNQEDQGFNFWELIAVQKKKNKISPLVSNSRHLAQVYKENIDSESSDMNREFEKNTSIENYASEYFNVEFGQVQRMLMFTTERIVFEMSFKIMIDAGKIYFLENDGKKTQVNNIDFDVEEIEEEAQHTWYPFFAKYNNGEDYGGTIDVSHWVFDSFMAKYDVSTNLNRKSYFM